MLSLSNKKTFFKNHAPFLFSTLDVCVVFLRPRRPFLGPRRGENRPFSTFSLSRFATVIEVFVVWLGRCFVRVLRGGKESRSERGYLSRFPPSLFSSFLFGRGKVVSHKTFAVNALFSPVSKKIMKRYGNMWNYGIEGK